MATETTIEEFDWMGELIEDPYKDFFTEFDNHDTNTDLCLYFRGVLWDFFSSGLIKNSDAIVLNKSKQFAKAIDDNYKNFINSANNRIQKEIAEIERSDKSDLEKHADIGIIKHENNLLILNNHFLSTQFEKIKLSDIEELREKTYFNAMLRSAVANIIYELGILFAESDLNDNSYEWMGCCEIASIAAIDKRLTFLMALKDTENQDFSKKQFSALINERIEREKKVRYENVGRNNFFEDSIFYLRKELVLKTLARKPATVTEWKIDIVTEANQPEYVEKGLKQEGYSLDTAGDWIEKITGMSPKAALKNADAILKKYGFF